MCVHFLFAVDVSCGSGELKQLVRLVHHQGGVELAEFQQVAGEHPTETRTKRVRARDLGEDMQQSNVVIHLCISLNV